MERSIYLGRSLVLQNTALLQFSHVSFESYVTKHVIMYFQSDNLAKKRILGNYENISSAENNP